MSKQDDFSTLFAPEAVKPPAASTDEVWKVLLVDDESDIHAVLTIALHNIVVEGRPLQLLNATSAKEAKKILAEHQNIALVLLDVVMESEEAGLKLVQYIRQELKNKAVQIILLTGQPGYAPQREVVMAFEINGYRLKSELTTDKIFVFVYAALRNYNLMGQLDQQRLQLEVQAKNLQAELVRRKKVEKALQLTQFCMDNAADAIFWIRPDASFAYANKSACSLFGYSRNELLKLHIGDINPNHPQEEWQEHWRELKTRHTITFEVKLHGKDNRLIEVEICANYFEFAGEEYNCAFVRDITARKKSEQEILKIATEWSAAMDASPDVIYLLDLNRCIIRANQAFYTMTGLSAETAFGQHIETIIHPHGTESPCLVCTAQEEKTDLVTTIEADHPDNPSGKPIEVTLTIIRDQQKQAISMLTVLHDMSHERKLQRELVAYREHLEKLVKARTAEIEEKSTELERINKLFVGRELKMIDLKEKINELEKKGRTDQGVE